MPRWSGRRVGRASERQTTASRADGPDRKAARRRRGSGGVRGSPRGEAPRGRDPCVVGAPRGTGPCVAARRSRCGYPVMPGLVWPNEAPDSRLRRHFNLLLSVARAVDPGVERVHRQTFGLTSPWMHHLAPASLAGPGPGRGGPVPVSRGRCQSRGAGPGSRRATIVAALHRLAGPGAAPGAGNLTDRARA